MNKEDIEILCKILRADSREDLAFLLDGALGELEQTSQYGSYWNSTVSYYNIFLKLEKYLKIRKISQEDKQCIFDAILIIYPHKDNSPEINSVDFLILRDFPSEMLEEEQNKIKNDKTISFEHEVDIKYQFLLEQIKKAQEKYQNGDFDGALTNVRTSIEAATFDIYKRITGQEIVGSGSLQDDYKKIKMLLNLAPEKKTNNAAKKMVSSFISAIDAIDEITNQMGDRHLRKVKPSAHHVCFCINATHSILNFLYSSLISQYKEKDNIYIEIIKTIYKDDNRFLSKEELLEKPDLKFINMRLDFFTKSILKNKLITDFEINHYKDSDVFFTIIDLLSETITEKDKVKIIKKHSENNQACGLEKFKNKYIITEDASNE